MPFGLVEKTEFPARVSGEIRRQHRPVAGVGDDCFGEPLVDPRVAHADADTHRKLIEDGRPLQAVYVATRLQFRDPWWRVAIGYVALMLVLDTVLWAPVTGALTRVMLPLTVGFNILLAREPRASRFWPWFVFGNLHLIPAAWVMPLL